MSEFPLPPKQYVPKRWGAERFHISERTISRMIASGELTAYKIGSSVRLDAEEVERVLTAHRIGGES